MQFAAQRLGEEVQHGGVLIVRGGAYATGGLVQHKIVRRTPSTHHLRANGDLGKAVDSLRAVEAHRAIDLHHASA